MAAIEPPLAPQVGARLDVAPVGELTVIDHNRRPVTSPLTVAS